MRSFLHSQSGAGFAALIIVAIGPLLIFMLPSIPFANDGNCDPWYIFGTFYLQPDLLRWYPDARIVGRLPEILPGWIFTQLLGGVAADYALFLTCYVTSVACMYGIVRRLVAPQIALLPTILFATHPLILGNYSGTKDAPPLVFDIIALYFVVRALGKQNRTQKFLMMAGSGIFLGIAMLGQLVIVAFAFANYVIYVICELQRPGITEREKLSNILAACLATLLGIVVAAVMLGSINVLLFGGTFLQVLNQFGDIVTVNANNAAGFWRAQWYLRGEPAGFFLFGALIAALNLIGLKLSVVRAHDDRNDFSGHVWATSIATLIMVAILFAYNQVGGVFMQYEYYYVFFTPYLVIVASYPLLMCTDARLFAKRGFVALFLAATIGAVWLGPDILPWLYAPPVGPLVALALALCAGALYAVSLAWRRRSREWALVYLLMTVLLSAVVRPVQIGPMIWSHRNLENRDAYARIRQGLMFLAGLHFRTLPKFWIDVGHGPWEIIAFPRSFKYCAIHEFPKPGEDQFGPFLPNDDVVVISSAPDIANTARAAFSNLGLDAVETARSVVNLGGIRYEIMVDHIANTTSAR